MHSQNSTKHSITKQARIKKVYISLSPSLLQHKHFTAQWLKENPEAELVRSDMNFIGD